MSTLKVTDIQSNGTGFNDVVSFQNASGTENGTLCRAWVNFDGTFDASSYGDEFTTANGGIRAAFNVSSVTDNGTGDYTVNFSSSLIDANYACVGMAHANTGGFMDMRGSTFGPDLKSYSQCRVRTQSSTGTVFDVASPTFAVFR